uniref:Uncharacterized protein n=1 Tax=Acrobeloides nanus TaxID=290746 RepID=A0A914CUK0_9BILA
MRLIFLILLFLTGLITFSVNAKDAGPGKAKSFFDAFKDVFLHNFNKETLTNDLIHVAKAFIGKEVLEAYYKLPKGERECILNEFTKIFKNMLHGRFISPDRVLKRIKDACPKNANGIQQFYDQYTPHMKEQMQTLYKIIQKAAEQTLPDSVVKGITEEATSLMEKFDFSEFLTKDKDEL